MAKVIGLGSAKSASQTIYDITCGSGSLLLKAHDEAKSTAGLDLTLYGQEMDNATAALAQMNMILHDCPSAEIWQDNVLASPHFKERTGILRPSTSSLQSAVLIQIVDHRLNQANDECGRFEFGVPPKERRLRLSASYPLDAKEHW